MGNSSSCDPEFNKHLHSNKNNHHKHGKTLIDPNFEKRVRWKRFEACFKQNHPWARVDNCDIVFVCQLLQRYDPEDLNVNGFSLLHLAAGSGSEKIVALLIEHGADVNEKDPNFGLTPLILASEYGHVRVNF
jgi:hypothetical protein